MNHDFKFLLTNRLNQDCLENMFSVIRSRRGHGDNPNPQEFLAAFRQIVVDKLLLPSESSNCQADIDKVGCEPSELRIHFAAQGGLSLSGLCRPRIKDRIKRIRY